MTIATEADFVPEQFGGSRTYGNLNLLSACTDPQMFSDKGRRAGLDTAMDFVSFTPLPGFSAPPASPSTEYIPGNLTDKQLESMKKALGELPEELDGIRDEVKKFGKDPTTRLVELMKSCRVLGYGDTHQEGNEARVLLKSMIPELKKAGATHFAIEGPPTLQPVLDEFMKTGELDRSKLPGILNYDDYLELLQEVRKAGLSIVAVDDRSKGELQRDARMADGIEEILKADKNNKVIFLVGGLHLEANDDPDYQVAAEVLRDRGYETRTVVVNSTYSKSPEGLQKLLPDLKKPVAITTADTKLIKEQKYIANVLLGWYDELIIIPYNHFGTTRGAKDR